MAERLSLEEQILVALRRITRAIALRSRALLSRHGLTAPQLATLKAVQRLQPVTAGTLAKEVHLGQPTVTGILNRLETRALVTRERGVQDRRSVYVSLTEAGRKILEESPSLLHEQFQKRLARLKEWEQTQMLATLQRIADMLDASDLEAEPLLEADFEESPFSGGENDGSGADVDLYPAEGGPQQEA